MSRQPPVAPAQSSSPAVSRRRFLGACAASALFPAAGWALRSARIRGRVTLYRRGLAGVVVSDGLSVGTSDTEGYFELLSDRSARFAFVTLPRGYRIPLSAAGTSGIHQPLEFDAAGEAQIGFELEPTGGEEETHRFLAVGDPQVDVPADAELYRSETVSEILALAKSESVAFGVTCGDLVDDTWDLFAHYQASMAATGVPFFQAIGNHDLDQAAGAIRDSRLFEAAFGPTYYSFNYGAVHYVVLDDVFWIGRGYIGYLDDAQLDWLAADLAMVEAGSKVVVFSHIPFASSITDRLPEFGRNLSQVANRDRLYELLDPYSAHLLTAHTHENEHIEHGGCHEHVLATACGAWWNGPVGWDGTPKGYHLYEVRGEDLSWRFRGSGLADDKQLRLYEPGSDLQNPDEIIANVWNWHTDWQVFWYEDGERRGKMDRRRGRDPMAVSLYEGPTRPLGKGSWVEPLETDHLFYAAPRPETRRVTVEAIDPWGGVFTETVELRRG